jgi:hypothetical protein
MDRNFLKLVFGHETGYVYTYQGQLDNNSDITVEFCNLINDHSQDTSVTKTADNIWLFWSKVLLENNNDFVLLEDLTTVVEPIILEETAVIVDQPTQENNPTGPTGGAE